LTPPQVTSCCPVYFLLAQPLPAFACKTASNDEVTSPFGFWPMLAHIYVGPVLAHHFCIRLVVAHYFYVGPCWPIIIKYTVKI
jgi:hypothetical protein